jgi:uncharacterized OsmC-like protein
MTTHPIAQAMKQVEAVLLKEPERGLDDDAPATARWQGGTRVTASHANGAQMQTDMPAELGGSGDQVSPGWMFRAGLASCLTTCIAMNAAAQGIELGTLEVVARSRSDVRGLLGMAEADGQPVDAASRDVQLSVRVAAVGVSAERLRALVDHSYRHSPVPCALAAATPIALSVEVAG